MADVAVLKEFLVAIGYKSDEHSQKKMVDAIAAVGVKAAELGTVMTGVAAGVVASVAKMADGMERLYFASRRTHAGVGNIKAFGFAASQMGSSAAAAEGSLESLARFLRSSPGASGLLNSLGIATQVHGHARDATDIMADLGQKFAQMPFWRAQTYASLFGIDEKTLLAMRQGGGQAMRRFMAQYNDELKAAGLNSDTAAGSAHSFMMSLRGLNAEIGILVTKVGSELTGKLAADIDKLRLGLVKNFDKINGAIEKIIPVALNAGASIARFALDAGGKIADLADKFEHLNGATQKVIIALPVLLAAWRTFNAGFAATPEGAALTAVFALAGAFVYLRADYQQWKRGAGSVIDWSRWKPEIDAAIARMSDLGSAMSGAGSAVAELGQRLWGLIGNATKSAAKWLLDTFIRLQGFNFDTVAHSLRMITDLLRGDWKDAWKEVAAVWTEEIKSIEGAVTGLGKTVESVVDGIVAKLNPENWLTSAGALGRRVLNYILGSIIPSAQGAEPGWGAGGPPQGTGTPGQGVGAHIPLSSAEAKARIKAAMDYFVPRWGVAHAAGIVANMMGESSGDPTAVNLKSGAAGEFQWLGSRKAAIEARYGKPITQMSAREQFDAYQYELMHSEAHSAADLNAATTPGESAYMLERFNERNGNDYAHSPRIAAAEKIAREYHDYNVNQNVNIHVAAGPTSQDTAERVARQQSRINADLLRNTKAHAS